MYKVRLRHIFQKRLEAIPDGPYKNIKIPESYLIFNAPRPLCGSRIAENSDDRYEWINDFVSGIFYAAVAPDDLDSIQINNDLDATVIIAVTRDEIEAWAQQFYQTSKIDIASYIKHQFDVVVRSYMHHHK